MAVAFAERPRVFLWLFLFLSATDWIDGKLAILLDQRSVLGALLDTWADAALYAAKDAVSVGELPRRRHPHFSSSLVRRWERGRDERRSRGQDRRSPGRCGADGAR